MDSEASSTLSTHQFRLDTRSAQTLLGLCSGLIADKNINDTEIAYLHTWIAENTSIKDQWPACEILKRITAIKSDGVVTEDERADLVRLLEEIARNNFSDTGAAAAEGPALPLDLNASITFNKTIFCFTGDFMYGTRAVCQATTEKTGASFIDTVNKKLNYLVIGSRVSPSWFNTTYGRKIEKATQLKASGQNLQIVSEKQWVDAISNFIQ